MNRGDRVLLQFSTLVSAVTGLVYLVMRYMMRSDDPFSALGHPWQPHMLAAHLLVGPVVVFALGLIAREHILPRFRAPDTPRGRASGLSLLLLGAAMVLSGYLIQVITAPGPKRLLVVLHIASGTLFGLLFLVHVRLAAARRERAGRPAGGARPARSLVMPPARRIQSIIRSDARGPRAEPEGRP
jgi:hypothetical protein